MKKQIRVKKWRVRVYWPMVRRADYSVFAVDALDARIIAFAMAGGMEHVYEMTEQTMRRVKNLTKIIKST